MEKCNTGKSGWARQRADVINATLCRLPPWRVFCDGAQQGSKLRTDLGKVKRTGPHIAFGHDNIIVAVRNGMPAQPESFANQPAQPVSPYGGTAFFCYSHAQAPGQDSFHPWRREQHEFRGKKAAPLIVAPQKIGAYTNSMREQGPTLPIFCDL